jgi:hypothetical protein
MTKKFSDRVAKLAADLGPRKRPAQAKLTTNARIRAISAAAARLSVKQKQP